MTAELTPAVSRPPSMPSGLSTKRVLGRTEPRLLTPPLVEGPAGPCGCGCALTRETSFGFSVDDFARDVLRRPLDPWERLTVIHGGELLPDGRPRFRTLLILVARQNGKTELLVVLTLYWLWVARVPLVLGTSSKLDYAAESWRKACRLAKKIPELRAEMPGRDAIRKANGEQYLLRATAEELDLDEGSKYKIAAANEDAGRSLTVYRLVLDELRQHHDYTTYDAAVPAMNAVPDAQAWCISNMGSDKSVVLNDLRSAALRFIEDGEGDSRLGLIEYSAPAGSSPLDVEALAQANPNLNRRIDQDALLGEARTALEKGGEKLTGFLTENMCINVPRMDPAIDALAWKACLDVGDLSGVRARVAACFDVSLDGQHATLAAAAVLEDGRVRIEPIAAWAGPDAVARMRAELPEHVARVRPYVLGWFPAGPAASVAAEMVKRVGWPPRGVKVEEITGDVPAVCMGFAEQVTARQIAQSDDPLINTHVTGAEKAYQGDRWRFTRRTSGARDDAMPHVDGAYAVAGATHLARTTPVPSKPVLVTGGKRRAAA